MRAATFGPAHLIDSMRDVFVDGILEDPYDC
jgi:hypothetical protein